ncbi:MAG: MerR family DNA-binding transcriptional regulator [Gemmatimonadetes bacterium]|nr:MerR family DNA-binding transcriptional regulator [Gemmatimonadota bacterium]
MERFRIGQVAERAGVRVDTVRFDEREGLIPEPPRTNARYRRYRPTKFSASQHHRGARPSPTRFTAVRAVRARSE